jgi:hypothetical protein
MTSIRRLLVVLAVVGTIVGMVALQQTRPLRSTPAEFARLGNPTMPFVPSLQFVTSAWFCAGVPNGQTQQGGAVFVVNPSDVSITGRISVFTDAAGATVVAAPFDVPGRESKVFDLPTLQPQGTFLSAMVEIYGGGGFVEQRADSPQGSAVSPCSNSTSSNWYFADGYTKDGSQESLVITNPFPSDAIVDISEATDTASRSPSALKGRLIKAQSVLVITQDELAKREFVLAVTVKSTRGRVVVGRSQEYITGAGRAGFTMTLGAPSLGDQFFFADGEVGPDVVAERYSIYNASDKEAVVNVVFLGLNLDPTSKFLAPDPITIPAKSVASLIAGDVPFIPQGRHGAVFSTETAGSIIVERAITRQTAETIATSVVMGAPPSMGSRRWSMAIGTELLVPKILVVLNEDLTAGTVTVKTLGAGGEVAVPGMEAIPLPASGVITIDISDDTAKGHPMIVESTQRIFVERSLPRSSDLRGRSGSFALPG